MAFLTRSSKSLLPVFCARQVLRDEMTNIASAFHRQIRGKRKKSKTAGGEYDDHTGLNHVKLLEDLIGYGPKDTVVMVQAGRMRNEFYPRQQARYILAKELREIEKMGIRVERALHFGRIQDEAMGIFPPDQVEVVPDVQAQLLRPERVTEILSANLPSSLVFYRVPIQQSPPEDPVPSEPPLPFPQRHLSLADMEAAKAAEAAAKAPAGIDHQAIPIYGSVTTADIAESVKELLAKTDEGARVVLGADDVKIVRTEEETFAEIGRFKTLGEFQVEIQVKGGEAVARTVIIKPQDSMIRRVASISDEPTHDSKNLE